MVVKLNQLDRLLSWTHDTAALGCLKCCDLKLCGGLAIKEPVFNCLDLCECQNPDQCPYICPKKKLRQSILARREVAGFDLLTLPEIKRVTDKPIPCHIALIDGWYRRSEPIVAQAVAIPLRLLFDNRSGEPRYSNADELRKQFRISKETSLVIDGVSRDQPIENYWGRARDREIVENIKSLHPLIVTTPNFSMFADSPRYNDLYNMKRQVIAWLELASVGVSAALHVNARFEFDYQRFAEFIQRYEAVQCICFEFGTGARRPKRRQWHINQLCQLQDKIERPLSIIVRGGFSATRQLASKFRNVSMIDTTPLRWAVKRKQGYGGSASGCRRTLTFEGQLIDDILQINIDARRSRLESLLGLSTHTLDFQAKSQSYFTN